MRQTNLMIQNIKKNKRLNKVSVMGKRTLIGKHACFRKEVLKWVWSKHMRHTLYIVHTYSQ